MIDGRRQSGYDQHFDVKTIQKSHLITFEWIEDATSESLQTKNTQMNTERLWSVLQSTFYIEPFAIVQWASSLDRPPIDQKLALSHTCLHSIEFDSTVRTFSRRSIFKSSSRTPTTIQCEHAECRNARLRRRDPLCNGVSKTKHVTRYKFLIQFLIWTYNFATGFVVSVCAVEANKRKTKTELLHAHEINAPVFLRACRPCRSSVWI